MPNCADIECYECPDFEDCAQPSLTCPKDMYYGCDACTQKHHCEYTSIAASEDKQLKNMNDHPDIMSLDAFIRDYKVNPNISQVGA